MEQYFVVRSTEDGTTIEAMSLEACVEEMPTGTVYLAQIPDNDQGYWLRTPATAVLVIRGEIVNPWEEDRLNEIIAPEERRHAGP
jgi:hypothetical protein